MQSPKGAPRPNNLPAFLSNFIGREREILQVKQHLSTYRLLTLTGPGGCGKTRLAIEAAKQASAAYPHGTWLVELASLSDPELVPQAFANILSIPEKAQGSINGILAEHLRSMQVLLLVDNCEHVIGACARLAESLLQSCPDLRILATSREALDVPGEFVYSVPPLSLPELQPWKDPESARKAVQVYLQSESVKLFVERATSVSSAFTVTEKNAALVADICRRLDGMPLAIELAAARVRAMSVDQIAGRLANPDSLNLLTTGKRTAPPRQQTLEATLDWSYALLSEAERRVLQRLSVFAGGCTLEAAEAVCAGEELVEGEALDALTQLVDKSLITVDRHGGEAIRYRLLETIRHYAHAKLLESGASHRTRDLHLDYYLKWAESASPFLESPDQSSWLELFTTEHDNLRTALGWSQQSETRAELGLQLAIACGYFWRLRGFLSEGRRHLSAMLSHPALQKRTADRARALFRAAHLAYLQSDYPACRELAQASLSILRDLGLGGQPETANVLDVLGELATEEGDYETAPRLFEEALTIYENHGDKQGVGDMLLQLGWAAMRNGDYEQANVRLEETLAMYRERNNNALIAIGLAGLGELAIRQGFYERAAHMLEESLSLRRALGDQWGIGVSLGSLGWVALRQGKFDRMKTFLAESLSLRIEIRDSGGAAWCLEKFAESALLMAQSTSEPLKSDFLTRAVRIYGTAAAIRAPVNSVIDPADQPEYQSNLEGLRAALGNERFEAEWEAGGKMDMEAGLDYVTSMPELSLAQSSQADRVTFGGLTPREREAALLIAQGKSNKEIAQSMTVRKKTVETYVTRILNKLGFKSRVEIATWIVEKGGKADEREE